MTSDSLTVGMLLFPKLTQLDLTGPYEVFTRLPDCRVELIWKTLDTVRADSGIGMLPSVTFATCPQLDIICVPGGPGVAPLMEDDETLEFLRRVAKTAQYVTSVCTGSLVLGAAGLLKGKRATTHWMSHDLLAAFGAQPVDERTVRDGNVVTGGGVTAGIDFALSLITELRGKDVAEEVQLSIEYDPAPPLNAGSPRVAETALVDRMRSRGAARQQQRAEIVQRAAARLG